MFLYNNNVSLHREDTVRDDNIRENSNSEEKSNDFKTFLVWACAHRISHVALSHLLSVWEQHILLFPISQNVQRHYYATIFRYH